MMYINLSDIAILNIKGADYPCIINGISKNEEAMSLLQNIENYKPLHIKLPKASAYVKS